MWRVSQTFPTAVAAVRALMPHFRLRGSESRLLRCCHVCFWVVLMALVLSCILFDVLVLLILQLVLVCKYCSDVCVCVWHEHESFGVADTVLLILQLVLVCKYCSNVCLCLWYASLLVLWMLALLVLRLVLACKYYSDVCVCDTYRSLLLLLIPSCLFCD